MIRPSEPPSTSGFRLPLGAVVTPARRGCHPALVVGRLQWRGELPRTHLNREIPRMRDVVGTGRPTAATAGTAS